MPANQSANQSANIVENDRFLHQLIRHEGSVKKGGKHVAYVCPAGALTIGYGHNLFANPLPGITAASQLDEAEAQAILQKDLEAFASALDDRLPWWSKLSLPRQAVLLNMAFNMGIAGLMTFKNTLRFVESGNYSQAAANMLASKWATQVKGRAKELAAQMKTGEWQQG